MWGNFQFSISNFQSMNQFSIFNYLVIFENYFIENSMKIDNCKLIIILS